MHTARDVEHCGSSSNALVCQRCAQIEIDLQNAEIDLRVQRRKYEALRREFRRLVEDHPASADVQAVLVYWQQRVSPRAKIPADGIRARNVRGRLKDGYTVGELCRAVDGCLGSDYHMGRTSKTQGKAYNDLELIARNEATVDKFKKLPAGAAIDRILNGLRAVKTTGALQWEARCPVHPDKHSSLAVGIGRKGIVVHCHAGCSTAHVIGALGIREADLFDISPPSLVFPTSAVETPVPQAPVALPSKNQIAGWHKDLLAHTALLDRLDKQRKWKLHVIKRFLLGYDGDRIVIPQYGLDDQLENVLRYSHSKTPKLLAVKGRSRDLFPKPETLTGKTLWIVEGEPDGITADGMGLNATAIPGVNGWRATWAQRVSEFEKIYVCFDCDVQGRAAALKVATELTGVQVVDLDVDRSDGFDLTDFVCGGGNRVSLFDLVRAAR